MAPAALHRTVLPARFGQRFAKRKNRWIYIQDFRIVGRYVESNRILSLANAELIAGSKASSGASGLLLGCQPIASKIED